MKKTSASRRRRTAEAFAEYRIDEEQTRSVGGKGNAVRRKLPLKKGKGMAIDHLENLLKKADRLTPSERLLLASRLIESVRQRDLSSPDPKKHREELKKSLGRLARMKVYADITDPIEWQRQIRNDRPLPKRDV